MRRLLIILSIMLVLIVLIQPLFDVTPSMNVIKPSVEMEGIDISHHNTINDWSKINESVDFVIMKATEGGTYKDNTFGKNWVNTKKHKMIRGAYHYFKPNISAYEQFLNFKNSVKLCKGDLPPVLDVEEKEIDMNEVNKWLKLVEDHYGVKPIVYSSLIFFKVFIENKIGHEYKLWLYSNELFLVKPSFDNYDCVVWQYNQKGEVNGIDGIVDLDKMLIDSVQLQLLLKH